MIKKDTFIKILLLTFALVLVNSLFAQLEFIENKGQWNSKIKFRSDFPTGSFYLEKNSFTVDLHNLTDLLAVSDFHHGLPIGSTTPTNASGVVGITPQTALVGEELVISGSGLPANTPAQLVWGTTENASWAVEVTPATVNYLGVNFTTTPLFVDIATITTDALGAFSYKTKTPSDFGGTHDIYAVVGGVAVGKGGMQIGRTFTMTPSSGPVGTKFTVLSPVNLNLKSITRKYKIHCLINLRYIIKIAFEYQ